MKSQPNHANKRISLVVVNAVSPNIEENYDIAFGNIQTLVDEGLADKVYELFIMSSKLKHKGYRIKSISEFPLEALSGETILAGGSLGNEHYKVFTALLEKAREARIVPSVNIPLDCTYSFTQKDEVSGDNYRKGVLGKLEMPIVDSYRKSMTQHAPASYSIDENGQLKEHTQLSRLRLWSSWQNMEDFLAKLLVKDE